MCTAVAIGTAVSQLLRKTTDSKSLEKCFWKRAKNGQKMLNETKPWTKLTIEECACMVSLGQALSVV